MAKAYVEAKLHVMGINDGVIILAMHFSFLYLGVEGQGAKGRHCNEWVPSRTHMLLLHNMQRKQYIV